MSTTLVDSLSRMPAGFDARRLAKDLTISQTLRGLKTKRSRVAEKLATAATPMLRTRYAGQITVLDAQIATAEGLLTEGTANLTMRWSLNADGAPRYSLRGPLSLPEAKAWSAHMDRGLTPATPTVAGWPMPEPAALTAARARLAVAQQRFEDVRYGSGHTTQEIDALFDAFLDAEAKVEGLESELPRVGEDPTPNTDNRDWTPVERGYVDA